MPRTLCSKKIDCSCSNYYDDDDFRSKCHVDIIAALYVYQVFPVLDIIFGFLDHKSLRCSELVSKTWKAALKANYNQYWKVLLQRKIEICTLWKRLYYDLLSKLEDQVSPDFCMLYNKVKYGIETLQKNWTNSDYTRNLLDCTVKWDSNVLIQLHGKSIVLYDHVEKSFEVWDRSSLKLKEFYLVPKEVPDEVINDSVQTVYQLYDNESLIYTSKSGQIVIIDLATKENKMRSPFAGMDYFKCINCFRAENGYLCVSIKTSDQHNSDVYIWKFHSSTIIDWENFKRIPSLAITHKDIIYVDHRYFVLRTENANEVVFKVYTVTKSPERKIRNIRLPKRSSRVDSILYHDGFVIAVLSYDTLEIKIVDVNTGISRMLVPDVLPFPNYDVHLRVNSGYLFVCTLLTRFEFFEFRTSSIAVWTWKFEDIVNPNVDASLPLNFFKAPIGESSLFSVNPFDIVILGRDDRYGRPRCDLTAAKIRVFNFLPKCNYCNEIRKSLRRCRPCKSAKYCNRACQTADWHHHKALCQEVQFLNSKCSLH